jgi:hypothetical protein
MYKFCWWFLFITVSLSVSGCAGAKIVIPSYTAPKEAAKLSKIETKDSSVSEDTYLALWLNPQVQGASQTNPKLEPLLIESIKANLTQTNFIALDPLGADKGVALSMNISNYEYKAAHDTISMALEVSFTLSRGSDVFLVKKYSDRKNRQSNDPTKLPTENELASQAVAKVVKYFISDISPLKTNQLREFKSLPSELEPVIAYAQRRDYKGAIYLMNTFKGEKNMNYYYDLAILYEAEASEKEDLKLLRYAQLNYSKAMELGGAKDDLIVVAKVRFDIFYDLLTRTKKQDISNQALKDDRDAMTGSSDSEYK